MLRIIKNLGCGPLFDDLALLHDTHTVGDAPHDAKVMGDEQKPHTFAVFQVF